MRNILRTPAWPKDIQRFDVRKGLPFPDKSVRFIYLSHSFHQFTHDESLALAKNCRHVLESRGVMRIVVPDLERAAREYLADPDPLAARKFLKQVDLHHNWRDFLHPGSSVTQMFDGRSLVHMLRSAGFEQVEVSSYRVSAIPEIDQIELEVRRHESLYVETRK
jgi:predicted SAM-dependent methyltransferase